MTAPIIAAGARKPLEGAGKALTGDIYTRRWTSVRGTGRKKTVVEHELRANPVGLGLGVVAAGAGALVAGLGLWFMQRKVTKTEGKDMFRVIDVIIPVYKTVVIVDEPAIPAIPGYWTTELTIDKDKTSRVWVPEVPGVPAITHEETVLVKLGHVTVKNSYGVPVKYFADTEGGIFGSQALTQREIALGYTWAEETKRVDIEGGFRQWWRYHTDKKNTYGIGERAGFGLNIDTGILG